MENERNDARHADKSRGKGTSTFKVRKEEQKQKVKEEINTRKAKETGLEACWGGNVRGCCVWTCALRVCVCACVCA